VVGRRLVTIYAVAAAVVVPLVAADWLSPPNLPVLVRQIALYAWGSGAILLAERRLFSGTWGAAARAIGFVSCSRPAMLVAAAVSLPMWLFLPIFAASSGVEVALRPDWLAQLAGVVLVNGITEEVIHRGFVFGHLRPGRSFVRAAALSALLFAAQHAYLMFTIGPVPGLASVVLAALLAFPMAFLFERGGHSLVAPAILHTSSNAPMIILALPQAFVMTALVPHMCVVLLSLYLVFACRPFLPELVTAARPITARG
jgi:membrane protease YdiL (CAAX protease family)